MENNKLFVPQARGTSVGQGGTDRFWILDFGLGIWAGMLEAGTEFSRLHFDNGCNDDRFSTKFFLDKTLEVDP